MCRSWEGGTNGIDPGVMMTKEANTRLNLCEKRIQSCSFAHVAGPSTVPFETDTGWCIVCQHDVHAARVRKPFNLIERVMSLCIALKPIRATSVI
jgi:hypothetical protein